MMLEHEGAIEEKCCLHPAGIFRHEGNMNMNEQYDLYHGETHLRVMRCTAVQQHIDIFQTHPTQLKRHEGDVSVGQCQVPPQQRQQCAARTPPRFLKFTQSHTLGDMTLLRVSNEPRPTRAAIP
eukprot:1156354-Pelagomonas_calceolata.AAC.6